MKPDKNKNKRDAKINNETHICLIVQHLIKSTKSQNVTLGECYEWASSGSDRRNFSYDLITVQSIARPAFVIPDNGNAKITSCSYKDKFYVLGREYFDRSGWEVQHTLNNEDFVYTIKEQNAYIVANQTTFGDKESTGFNEYHQVRIEKTLDDDEELYEDMEFDDEDGDDEVQLVGGVNEDMDSEEEVSAGEVSESEVSD